MKYWPSQLFPVFVLAILAGLSFWLQSTVEPGEARPDGKLRHDPDAIAENIVVRRFDETGQVKYRLIAPYLVHFPDDDTSEAKQPTLLSYRPGQPTLSITADHAKVTANGEVAHLRDNVRITRAALGNRPELLATTDTLTAYTEEGYAVTDSPVKITQGPSWLTGVGARIDSNASTFTLLSQVRGYHIRSRGTP